MESPITWVLKNETKEIRDLFNPNVQSDIVFSQSDAIDRDVKNIFRRATNIRDREENYTIFRWLLRVLREEMDSFNTQLTFPMPPFGPLSVPYIEIFSVINDKDANYVIQHLTNGDKTSFKRFVKGILAEQLHLGEFNPRDYNNNNNPNATRCPAFQGVIEYNIVNQYPNEAREIYAQQMRNQQTAYGSNNGNGRDLEFDRPDWFTKEIEHDFKKNVTWLNKPSDLDAESAVMKHCVSTYKNACRYFRSVIFAIKTNSGLSTLEIVVEDDRTGLLRINQHKAINNKPPHEENIKVGEEFLAAVNNESKKIARQKI